MRETIDIMLRYFSDTKLAGSYFLLFLVSIVLLYYLNREKNRWFILYGISLLVVVVMNPVIIWVLMQVFPSLESYGPVTLLLPVLIYIPFAAAELNDSIRDMKTRRVVTGILVFLVFICGNMCGIVRDYSVSDSNITTQEELDMMEIECREDDMSYAVKEMLDEFLGGGGVGGSRKRRALSPRGRRYGVGTATLQEGTRRPARFQGL